LDANCGFGYTEGLKFKSQDAQTMSDSNRKTSGVRVRFAPSPTGYLHVGGARTALFNWLFARRQGGTMILRVEDTDAERNKPELVQGILDGLQWLGVNWDEGPFYQSQRTELYLAAAKKCLENGAAFLCYCPAEKYAGGDHAEPAQDEEPKGGGPRRVTRCTCRDGKPSTPGVKPAVRFKVPLGETTKFHDAVFGEREFSNDEIEDFVLLRSGKGDEEFGQSMYQLGVVVDDIDMRITHVIRGADHLSNTPKQVLLYRALRADPPVFAHVPLILGPDKSRLSKRHGATDVNMYRAEGFLPEAFRNFLALLGWSPGGDEEFLRTKELIEKFSLEGVSHTNAVFDRPKLEWFNTQYLQKLPIEELLPEVEKELKRSGLWKPEWAAGAAPGPDGRDHAWFAHTVDLLRPRIRLLPDFSTWALSFFSTWARAFFSDEFARDPAAKEKFWKDPKVPELLAKLANALAALTEWNHDACDHTTRAVAEAGGVKAGLLINATRVAIVGRAVAPPLFDTMVVIGQRRVVSRLKDAARSIDKAKVEQVAAGGHFVYFDTDVLHRIGVTFTDQRLPLELSRRIVVSPIAVLEALSHLPLTSGEKILKQIQAIHNWVDPENARLLPWPTEAIAQLGFQTKIPGDDLIANVEKTINICLAAESVQEVRASAVKLKDALDKMKATTAGYFQALVTGYRNKPFTDQEFSEVWVSGIAKRINIGSQTRPTPEIVEALSAYHEYEKERLKVAASNPQYVPDPNDLLDSEQLVYLADPALRFLVCDGGYMARIKKSPQIRQIHRASLEQLSSVDGVKALLQTLTA
jgi:glutamyl-tRNA synthetase